MIRLENISFDHCIKCTVCTVYCPVARATPRYPGPKASGPDTERLRIKNPGLVDESLQYCNNCKRCEIACPSDVRIADIIQTAKWKYLRRRVRPRDFLLSRTDLLGRLATLVSPAANAASGSPLVKTLLSRFVRIPRQRTFPRYARGTFARWFRQHAPDQDRFPEKVVYFHGCYVNYNDHDLGRDVVRVLNALGVGVIVTREVCCGVPLIAGGYAARARKNARRNLAALSRAVIGDAKIVSASSTCVYALKNEYPNFLGLDNSALRDRVEYIAKFLVRRLGATGGPPLRPLDLTAAYHAPCHLERLGGAVDTVELLRQIPGLDLKLLPSECCGLAGTYGFKAEFHPIAQAVGADLFERIRALRPEVVVTDCETCKWQIEENTPYQVVHPVTLLARSMGPESYSS
ncbi:MAG: anaerobic glycerol-3-phosphate dehydrogenase subunit GlpC [Thermodesulfobacteriota bacterium]